MQLINSNGTILASSPSVAQRLALAAAALVSGSLAHAGDWQIAGSTLIYQEQDNRVQAIEPALNLTRQYEDESSINIHLVFDSLSGASPNGAMAARQPQTFTSPSGFANGGSRSADAVSGLNTSGGLLRTQPVSNRQALDDDEEGSTSYTVAAGKTPLDPTFMDQRVMGSLGWSGPLSPQLKATLGGAVSAEQDFTSVSANAALAQDFNGKNSTVSAGVSVEHDVVTPHGGVPLGLTGYTTRDLDGNQQTKQVFDLSLGLSQVFSRRWLSQFNLALSASRGYQSDPYKILTVANEGDLILDPADATSWLYLYEKRPQQRLKKILYWQNKWALFSDDSLDLSARLMKDDWGINSHTLDATWHWQYSPNLSFEPHYRFYRQSAADFYRPFLRTGEEVDINGSTITALVDNASSDGRLAAFSARTLGIRMDYRLSDESSLSLRLEHYQQYDENKQVAVAAGSDLSGMQQFAPLAANWIQAGFVTRW